MEDTKTDLRYTRRVTMLTSEDLYNDIAAEARRQGLNVSDWLRFAARQQIERAKGMISTAGL